MIVDKISNKQVKVGDLVFILHPSKPMKTGWYRATNLDVTLEGRKEVILVFEKSVHPYFSKNNISLVQSRRKHGVFLMKYSTYTFDNNYDSCKYLTLLVATGVSATRIVQSGYEIPKDLVGTDNVETKDVIVSKAGISILRYLNLIQTGLEEDTNLENFMISRAKAVKKGEEYYTVEGE